MKISTTSSFQSASDLFSALIRAKPESLDEALEKALITICQFAKAEHCALYYYFEDNNSVIMTHHWPVISPDESDALQKALGILAGGIAHDFNNLFGGIFGFIDLAAMITKEPKVAELLNDSLSTIDRARGLTQQLLTFSKGGTPVKKD